MQLEITVCDLKLQGIEFRYADVERACPGVSRPTIVRVLGALRDAGEIRCVKGGRDAMWERLVQ